jgi:hypothetical protein
MAKRQSMMVRYLLVGWVGMVGCSANVVTDPMKGTTGNPSSTNSSMVMDSGQATQIIPENKIHIDFDATIPTHQDAYTGPTEDANCGLVPFVLDRTPSPVLLLQDRSTSMKNWVGGGVLVSRWDSVRAAVKNVLQRTEANVAWGLHFFPNQTRCLVSPVPEVLPELVNAKSIAAKLDAIKGDVTGLTDGTPTAKILDAATNYFKTVTKAKDKYVVLATDGQPTCLKDNPDNDDFENAEAAAKRTVAAGIKLAVVGIAFRYEPGEAIPERMAFLNRLAEMGGMARNDPIDSPEIKYYPANNTEQLTAAFQAIAEKVITCTFNLPKAPPSKDDVAVKLDGVKLPRSSSEGWEYDTSTTLSVHGSYCDKIKKNEGSIDIKIIMGCPGQIIL